MKSYGFPPSFHQEGSTMTSRRDNFPANCRSSKTPDQSRLRSTPGPSFKPNFVIHLRSGLQTSSSNFNADQVRRVVDRCLPAPELKFLFPAQFVAASLQYQQWKDARDAIVSIWDQRLKGFHFLCPYLISKVSVPSDKDELTNSLKALFQTHVQSLLQGATVRKCRAKIDSTEQEMAEIDRILSRRRGVGLLEFDGFQRKKEGLVAERRLINKRLEEFNAALQCILSHIDGSQYTAPFDDEKLDVIRLPSELDWNQIHFVISRECRRLEDGLPIYSFRREILGKLQKQQAMVLIGETGSGKSTQLVQFIADSGLAGAGSIVCTQPRKIAAISLAERVREESNGCYKDKSVIYCPSFSSAQGSKSKVIFMTDHCLLQHYMKDETLSGVSYIIIDEAHERSLNTDLLLAVLKSLMLRRVDLHLRLIVMSATADACKFSDYLFGCGTYHVVGRNFPVEIKYVPTFRDSDAVCRPNSGNCASYVSDVLKTVNEIHRTEKEGAVLAFLTSQTEVEWACENLRAPSAVALPLHGKLSSEEQGKVFKNFKERKIIFATNLAETSLTIPGVKYVVDSGMVKDSRFDPSTGMNVLRVGRISKSSADQRAGRAGRTDLGKCYRLYSEDDFQLMPSFQDPEIHKVHLGIAVLKILALGIKNVRDFDFVDAPTSKAIDMAIDNLIHLGAITCKNGAFDFTDDGRYLVKLGIEPRLGKLILESLRYRLCKEGLVLAAVMANASSIFFRVGNGEEKLKSDCLKVPFCHRDGDLFTLLSVYKEWEKVPKVNQSKWCVNNSVNAKSMRRCKEIIEELENCLKNELKTIIPNYWYWNPDVPTEHDKNLKKVILSSLSENVAMYSGYDRCGYQVALTRQYLELHPSCSLLIYSQKPSWVVFGDILSISSQYLVCVTAINPECLYTLPHSLLDVPEMEKQKLLVTVLSGFGTILLKRFCGRANSYLSSLVSRIQNACMDERIGVEVDYDKNEIQLFASSKDMETVTNLVDGVLNYEAKWLRDECIERYLYRGGPGITPSLALMGAGGAIRHLELQKRYLTVEISHSNVRALDDKELLIEFETRVSGICTFHKHAVIGQEGEDTEKWGKITFLTPDAAERAVMVMNGIEVNGSMLKVCPSKISSGGDRFFSFPGVRAKVCWPRRLSRGYAFVKCARQDISSIVHDFSDLTILGRFVHCEISKNEDCVLVSGIDKELSEPELLDTFRTATNRIIYDIHLVRGDAVNTPSHAACEEALAKEIAPFIPSKNSLGSNFHVQVYPPEMKDYMMKAVIVFDERLHLEAAIALDHIQGKVLAGCRSWQKIQCQHMFQSSLYCPAPVYQVVKQQLNSLFERFKHRKGGSYSLERNDNGSYRVKIAANATKIVADMRRPLEQILNGKNVTHGNLTPSILQLLFSKDGITLVKTVQRETGTYILYDRQNLNVRIFGPKEILATAEYRFVRALLLLNDNKQHEIRLRGKDLPQNLMKEVVNKFGPDLHGLKEKVPEAELMLNTRRHALLVRGEKEMKQRVEEMVHDVARSLSDSGLSEVPEGEISCPICLCEVDDCYKLEACCHRFCRSCLVEQCESAIKSHEGFPLQCTHEKCETPILFADLRTLLMPERLEDLFRASLAAFVTSSGGTYRFCPSPDCPAVYRVCQPGMVVEPFLCGACCVETCTRCHLEHHPYTSCEKYREFKDDPDTSLKDWCKGKEQVKCCPICGYTIEKVDGCNHVECKCGKHICWVCLSSFDQSTDCYDHLRSIHLAII